MPAGVPIDNGSAVKVARNLGRSGKPMPEEVASDPTLRAAYYDGAGTPDPQTPEKHPQEHPTKAGGTPSSAHGARSAPATRKRTGASTTRRRRPPSRRAVSRLAAHPLTLGSGSAGGLMLAIFVYPIGLAMLHYGPNGAVMWLKAKFLNEVPGITGGGPSAPKGSPAPPGYYNNGTAGGGPAGGPNA